jgi:hypothetical protein
MTVLFIHPRSVITKRLDDLSLRMSEATEAIYRQRNLAAQYQPSFYEDCFALLAKTTKQANKNESFYPVLIA